MGPRTYCGTVGLGGGKEEGRRGDGHAGSSEKGAVGRTPREP